MGAPVSKKRMKSHNMRTNAHAPLPDPGLIIDSERTAVVITDRQNDFLSPDGVTWGLVGASGSYEGNGDDRRELSVRLASDYNQRQGRRVAALPVFQSRMSLHEH